MSLIPIYTGFWHDYSRDGSLAWTLTLTVRWSGVLLAALSTFVGLVGTCFWSLLAFAIHQWRAKSGDEDTVYFQQQVIYRNPSSAPGALIDLFKVCWAWSPRRSGRTRPNRLRRRYFLFSIPPFLVFIGFTAASVFVGEVTRPSYQSNDVEIKPTNCGTVLFDLKTISGFRDNLLKSVNDTLAARAYARNCYGPNTALGACSLYPTQSLPYSVSETPCPFGKDPTGKELCSANSALQVDTGLLDINKYLGINTPKKDRLLFRKSATCSPINSRPYAKTANIPDGAGYAIWNYYLGPINGLSNYTLSYDTHTANDIVGYTLESFSSNGGWTPITALQVSNADITAIFLASNGVSYINPVSDPWFSAHTSLNISQSGILNKTYMADSFVSVMACTDQYQLCNPTSSPLNCTILGSVQDVLAGSQQINLTPYQLASADRLIPLLVASSIFGTVNDLSGSALLATDRLADLISTGLPSNQWQIELQGWFETSLAGIQADVVSWPAQPTDLGPFGSVLAPNATGDPVSIAAHALCSAQRIRNTGAYQSFSTLGLIIVIVLGTTIIILSFTVEFCVASLRKRKRQRYQRLQNKKANGDKSDKNKVNDDKGDDYDDCREIARIADRRFQLQRMVLVAADPEVLWEGRMDDVPVTADPGVRFLLPRRTADEEDFRYCGAAVAENAVAELKQGSAEGGSEEVEEGSRMERPGPEQREDWQVPLMGRHASGGRDEIGGVGDEVGEEG